MEKCASDGEREREKMTQRVRNCGSSHFWSITCMDYLCISYSVLKKQTRRHYNRIRPYTIFETGNEFLYNIFYFKYKYHII